MEIGISKNIFSRNKTSFDGSNALLALPVFYGAINVRDNLFFENRTSILETTGAFGNGPGNFECVGNMFFNNVGIPIDIATSECIIMGNYIYGNSIEWLRGGAMVTTYAKGTGEIISNAFVGNKYTGIKNTAAEIKIYRGGSFYAANNRIFENTAMHRDSTSSEESPVNCINIENESTVLRNNDFIGEIFSFKTIYNVDAKDNWWGSSSPIDVQRTIIDFFDNSTLGVADVSTILTRQDTTGGMISPPRNAVLNATFGKIDISWEKIASYPGFIEGYKVYYACSLNVSSSLDSILLGTEAAEGISPILVGDISRFTLTNLVPDNKYYIAVAGCDSDGKRLTLLSPFQEITYEGNPTNVNQRGSIILNTPEILPNYPNPFNPSTTIEYIVGEPNLVLIYVYNQLGQRVKNLVDEFKTSGKHSIIWDGTNESGFKLASGIYFIRMQIGKYTASRKIIFVK